MSTCKCRGMSFWYDMFPYLLLSEIWKLCDVILFYDVVSYVSVVQKFDYMGHAIEEVTQTHKCTATTAEPYWMQNPNMVYLTTLFERYLSWKTKFQTNWQYKVFLANRRSLMFTSLSVNQLCIFSAPQCH